MPDPVLSSHAHPMPHMPLPGISSLGPFVERQLGECRRSGTTLAVLSIRLEGFEIARRRYGDAVAERVLQAAWARLKHCIRASDLAVREEHTEFGVLLPGVSESVATMVQMRAINALSMPYWVGVRVDDVSARSGAAVYPDAGDTGEALLLAACQARWGCAARC